MRHIVIVGNGITGITAARHIRKYGNDKVTVISSESPHFYSRTALMYIYMRHMTFEDTKPYEDWFWEKNRITLHHDHVTRIDIQNRKLFLKRGQDLSYDILVIATGSQSNTFGWPGQHLKGVQGLYNLKDLEQLEKNTIDVQNAVVVGGGLIGIELAEMLLSRNIPVTFLVREKHFWDIVLPDHEAKLIERHINDHHVDLRLETELKEILPDDNGHVGAVVTQAGETITCQFVGLTVGVKPNLDVIKNSTIESDRGILVNEFFETNIEHVYAGGDCAQLRTPLPGRKAVEPVWYTGKMHGEHIAANICGNRRPYNPGIWFNSAKFFDIEYQTYGSAPNKLPADQNTFYWEHPMGKKAIRINYRKDDQRVTGFNLIGIRGRHQMCNYWINSGCTFTHVLQNIGAMNFDPEFFESFEKELLTHHNEQSQRKPLKLMTSKGLFSRYMTSLLKTVVRKGKPS